MAYTTLANLKKSMPAKQIEQLTDDHGTGSIVTEVVDDCISSAQEEIDGYLKGRYPDDIADVDLPPMIIDIATKLAAFNLFGRKLSTTLPPSIETRYKNAIKQLERIQSGKVTPFPEADEPVIIKSNKDSDSRVYNSTLWATY